MASGFSDPRGRRKRLRTGLAALLVLTTNAAAETAVIDPAARTTPFPHFWEAMMGSGRAALALRDAWRQDLRTVKGLTGLGYVRFHAIFHDEMGVYGESAPGVPAYDFQYVDQVYDAMLATGVRPFVELSFMPRGLAARPDLHPFWYHPIVAPPKSDAAWAALIRAFAEHLVDRYGIDEVAQWYFEVWNEPNLDFWTGKPQQASYFRLYDTTARALKAVSPRLRVGGPATAQAAWVEAFLKHAAAGKVPVDFVTTHIYGTDDASRVLGPGHPKRLDDLVCRSLRMVRDQIAASPLPGLPLVVSEVNATFDARSPILASSAMGPWLAETISGCDGLTAMLSYWTFSDVFEEQGVARKPFAEGFGLIGLDGIPKPSLAAFAALHLLGDQRIPVSTPHLLATRRNDGAIVVAAWNGHGSGPAAFDLALGSGRFTALLHRVDEDHANAPALYRRMGSPTYPSRAQVAELCAAGMPTPPETAGATDGHLRFEVPADGLAVVEIRPVG
jgi:xylan 1,4-beta-xylosidase